MDDFTADSAKQGSAGSRSAEPGLSAPAAAFPGAAAGGLAPVAGEIAGAKDQARQGKLKLTEGAAKELLDSLRQVHATLHELVEDSAEIKDPLKLGDNFIGHAMSDRLQGAAAGGTRAAIPVLKEFGDVLGDLELTVRAAAGRYVAEDEHAEEALLKAAKQFDMQDTVDERGES